MSKRKKNFDPLYDARIDHQGPAFVEGAEAGERRASIDRWVDDNRIRAKMLPYVPLHVSPDGDDGTRSSDERCRLRIRIPAGRAEWKELWSMREIDDSIGSGGVGL